MARLLALGASLSASPTVNGTLILSSGQIVSGAAQQVSVANPAAGAVTRTGGWVNGTLQKAFATGLQSFTFPIGGTS